MTQAALGVRQAQMVSSTAKQLGRIAACTSSWICWANAHQQGNNYDSLPTLRQNSSHLSIRPAQSSQFPPLSRSTAAAAAIISFHKLQRYSATTCGSKAPTGASCGGDGTQDHVGDGGHRIDPYRVQLRVFLRRCQQNPPVTDTSHLHSRRSARAALSHHLHHQWPAPGKNE